MNMITRTGEAARALYAERNPGAAEGMLDTVEFVAAGRIDSDAAGAFVFGLLGAGGQWVTENWDEITRCAAA